MVKYNFFNVKFLESMWSLICKMKKNHSATILNLQSFQCGKVKIIKLAKISFGNINGWMDDWQESSLSAWRQQVPIMEANMVMKWDTIKTTAQNRLQYPYQKLELNLERIIDNLSLTNWACNDKSVILVMWCTCFNDE